MCFINPGFTKAALEEIERCKANGFVGVKMYHQYRMDDPVQFPIVEKCIELDMPILMHAGKLNFEPESQPRISQGEYFAHVAQRYPEASLIMAHITGGGTGQLKQSAVINWVYERLPAIVKIFITAATLERWVDEAVERAKVEWEKNANIKEYIESGQTITLATGIIENTAAKKPPDKQGGKIE